MPIISSRRIGTAEYPDVEGIGLTCDWINRTYKKLGHTTRHWMNSGYQSVKEPTGVLTCDQTYYGI